MICDPLRSHHLTYGTMVDGDGREFAVRWYPAAEGAQTLPIWSAFGSSVWEDAKMEFTGVGFTRVGEWRRKRHPAPPGTEYHGKPEWFVNGLPPEVYANGVAEAPCQERPNRFGGWSTGSDTRFSRVGRYPGGLLAGGSTARAGGVLAGGTVAYAGGIRLGGSAVMGGGLLAGGALAYAGGDLVGGELVEPPPPPVETDCCEQAIPRRLWARIVDVVGTYTGPTEFPIDSIGFPTWSSAVFTDCGVDAAWQLDCNILLGGWLLGGIQTATIERDDENCDCGPPLHLEFVQTHAPNIGSCDFTCRIIITEE